jgi:hypothetical protein
MPSSSKQPPPINLGVRQHALVKRELGRWNHASYEGRANMRALLTTAAADADADAATTTAAAAAAAGAGAARRLREAITTQGCPQLQQLADGTARLVCQRCTLIICHVVDPVTARPHDSSGPLVLHACPSKVPLGTADLEAAGLIQAGQRCGLCRGRVDSSKEVHHCNGRACRHYLLEMTQLGTLLPTDKAALLHLRQWHGHVVMLYNHPDFGAEYLSPQQRAEQQRGGRVPALQVCHLWQCRSSMLEQAGVLENNMGLVAMHPLQVRQVQAFTQQMVQAACRVPGTDTHTPALATGGPLFAYTGTRHDPQAAYDRQDLAAAAAATAAAAAAAADGDGNGNGGNNKPPPAQPPLSLFTIRTGKRGRPACAVDPSGAGGLAMQINAAHGQHANLEATVCSQLLPPGVSGSSTGSGRRTSSSSTWWDEVRFEVLRPVNIGQELLYDYQSTVPADDPQHSIRCVCPHQPPHYLYRTEGAPCLGKIRHVE